MAPRKRSGFRHSKKKNWKKMIKGKTTSTGKYLVNKVYSYVFHPKTQFITNTGSPSEGIVAVTGYGAPIISSGVGTPVAASSGFPNYFDFGVGIDFGITDLQTHPQWRGLYDQFKIAYIECDFTYLSNSANINGVMILPTIYTVCDNDNSTTPANQYDVEGRQGHKVMKIGNGDRTTFKIRIKPKLANLVYANDGGTNIGYAQQADGWVDCAYPLVKYYGLKMWIQNMFLPAGAATNAGMQFNWKYVVQFRGALNEY